MKTRFLSGILAVILIVGSIYSLYIWTSLPFRAQTEVMWVPVAAAVALIAGLLALSLQPVMLNLRQVCKKVLRVHLKTACCTHWTQLLEDRRLA